MTTLQITPETTPEMMAIFVGQRVRIDNTDAYANDPTERDRVARGLAHAEQIGRITSAPRHLTTIPGVGTDIVEESHGSCRGGHTACFIPYGAVISLEVSA